MNNRTGAAFHVRIDERDIASAAFPCGKVSIFDAEMAALATGIKHAVESEHGTYRLDGYAIPDTLHVWCDNEAAIQAIWSTSIHSGQMMSILACRWLRQWLEAHPDRRVHLHWLPSHYHIKVSEWNDKVDDEAQKAANIGYTDEDRELPDAERKRIIDANHPKITSLSVARSAITDEVTDEWRRVHTIQLQNTLNTVQRR